MLDGFLRYSFSKRGVRVLSATQDNAVDPMLKLTQGILPAVAEYERYLLTMRLAGGRRAKAKLGGYAHGQAPYGARAARGGSRSLTVNEREYPALAYMQRLRAEGRRSERSRTT
jgi:DNA invertase Pin-like site-specific DNA recombinase